MKREEEREMMNNVSGRVWLTMIVALLLGGAAFAQEPEPTEDPVEEAAVEEADQEAPDLIRTLKDAGSYTVLIGALEKTGLADVLQGTQSFTLFAPTDDAFAKLPEGTLEGLDGNQLASILQYHVVEGEVALADAASRGMLQSVMGESLTLEQTDQGALVNGAVVIAADTPAQNGVVHGIDAVLMPTAGQ